MTGRLVPSMAALVLAALVVPAEGNAGQADFSGRTITIVSGGGPGGGVTFNARVVAEHWARHIPGQPTVIVQAMPGGGGVKMMSYMFNAAPRDGFHVGAVLPPSINATLLREMRYEPDKLFWLGSVSPLTVVSTVWHTAPARTVEEARKTEVIMAASNRYADSYIVASFLNAVSGTKFKTVLGYAGGGASMAAMERGEVHGRTGFYTAYPTTKPDWVRENKIVHLVQLGPRVEELHDVPSLSDFADTDKLKQIVRMLEIGPAVGHGFFLPPEVPRDRAAVLYESFADTMADPKFREDALKRNLPFAPSAGKNIQRLVAEAMQTPPSLVEEFKRMIQLSE